MLLLTLGTEAVFHFNKARSTFPYLTNYAKSSKQDEII